jgi:hypothetical protein
MGLYKSEWMGVLCNMLGSKGQPGKVVRIRVGVRKTADNIVTCIRKSLIQQLEAAGNKGQIGIGGVFRLVKGKIKAHVMPDFKKTVMVEGPEVNDWLKWFTHGPNLVCLTTFLTGDPSLASATTTAPNSSSSSSTQQENKDKKDQQEPALKRQKTGDKDGKQSAESSPSKTAAAPASQPANSNNQGMNLRLEHTHFFSDTAEQNEGGHYHYDITPDEVEYEAYLVAAERVYRIGNAWQRDLKPVRMKCACGS